MRVTLALLHAMCLPLTHVQQMKQLDEKYFETVQLPVKAKFGICVANTWQHLPRLLLEV